MSNKIIEPVFIIAEIAQAHDGSLGIAHSYIDVLADAGVNAVKFQTHIAEAESSAFEPFRVNFSYEDKTRYDYWKRMEFSIDQWKGLKEHCKRVGLEFMSSPFSIAAVNLLEELDVKRYKIGSGEVTNTLLLDRIGQTKKPVIVSSGMSSISEIENAVKILQLYGSDVTLLQCTTAYPTEPELWGLNVIREFSDRFNVPIGFSDHSGNIYACLAATALGARVLEFHAVFHRTMFGPDAKSSLTPEEISFMVKGIRAIEKANLNPVVKDKIEKFHDLKIMFGKSLAVNRSVKKGEIISFSVLESKKPGDKGIPAAAYKEIIGKKIKKDMAAFSFINYDDLE